MEKHSLFIAKEFGKELGGRWIRLGPFSGEEFYESLLKVKFLEARKDNDKLHIYLDEAKPYGSSFLDQSFGELARTYGKEEVKKNIEFHTKYFQWIVNYVNNEVWK